MLNDFTLSGGKAVLWLGKEAAGRDLKRNPEAGFVQRALDKYDKYLRERVCGRSRAARRRKN
jgi:hypothetical protein